MLQSKAPGGTQHPPPGPFFVPVGPGYTYQGRRNCETSQALNEEAEGDCESSPAESRKLVENKSLTGRAAPCSPAYWYREGVEVGGVRRIQ
jgi:hypothetical protein